MLFTDRKTDVCSNRFGGDGDVIINHYIDEKMINDSIVMYVNGAKLIGTKSNPIIVKRGETV